MCSTFQKVLKKQRQTGGHAWGGTWVFFGWVCAARDSKLAGLQTHLRNTFGQNTARCCRAPLIPCFIQRIPVMNGKEVATLKA